MAKPVILLYDPHDSPWVPQIKGLCAVQGLRFRPVEEGETGRALEALARSGGPAPGEAEPLPEPLLVLCGLGSAQLDRFLAALRRAGVPRTCLKAVLTPANAGWTLAALYRELCLERLRMGGTP